MLLYHTVKEIRTAFHLRPLLLIPTTSLSLSSTVHLCTQHHLTSVSLSLSTLYHPLVPSGSQWRMPEPGEVAREAGQRNLPRHQHQTHHARVTRPRTGLLSWDYSALPQGSLAQRQEHPKTAWKGKGAEERGLARARMAHLNSQLCHKLLAWNSNLPLLQHTAGAACLQHQGPHKATKPQTIPFTHTRHGASQPAQPYQSMGRLASVKP